jgi:hypothetical protein
VSAPARTVGTCLFPTHALLIFTLFCSQPARCMPLSTHRLCMRWIERSRGALSLQIWWMTKDPSSMLHPAKSVPCCLVWVRHHFAHNPLACHWMTSKGSSQDRVLGSGVWIQRLQSGQVETWPMSVVAHANSHISRLGAAMGYSVPLVSSLGRMEKEGPYTRRLEVQRL